MSDHQTVTLNLYLEIYVDGRDEPFHWPMALTINDEVKKVSQVMTYAHGMIEDLIGSKRWFTVVDDIRAHYLVMTDHIRAVTIAPPDRASIPWLEPEDNEIGDNEDG